MMLGLTMISVATSFLNLGPTWRLHPTPRTLSDRAFWVPHRMAGYMVVSLAS